ncbi:cytochrome c oxidase subunit II [Fulvivirgaceae bacterium BMA10]|uniref:Cytochrome c oxidase subunit 2 n=1 Tax=Splendidivirga corallicola TaxID=3051826 RepID=A0ABT8KQ08_9BACT|nr:cytochrome c oxidase subunit II [Fulvivirgaceae bacterium BMA10]
MLQFVLIAGVVLIVIVLGFLFRINTLVTVVKGAEKHPETKSNKINGLLMFLFMVASLILLCWYSYARFDDYTMPVASEHGVVTDNLFWVTTAVTGFVFILTNILLFYFSFKYQYKENERAKFYPENNKLEIIWTVIPAIVLTVLVFTGWKAWTDITDAAPEDAEVIEIMGQQFAWSVRYPGKDGKLGKVDYRRIDATNNFGMDLSDRNAFDDFMAPRLYVPKGRPVELKIRARDVLHSVYAPHFRLKMDAVPGMPTRFWFTPTKTTEEMRQETNNPEFNYEIACAEICGRGHFSMRLLLVVEEPEVYDKWYAEQQSWLSQNPDYLSQIPVELEELAQISVENTKGNKETENKLN